MNHLQNQLLVNFFETTSSLEISSTLSSMLEIYIAYAPISRIDLANAYVLTNNLDKLFKELDYLKQNPTESLPLHIMEEIKECLHN